MLSGSSFICRLKGISSKTINGLQKDMLVDGLTKTLTKLIMPRMSQFNIGDSMKLELISSSPFEVYLTGETRI